jgi:hypothetical protein
VNLPAFDVGTRPRASITVKVSTQDHLTKITVAGCEPFIIMLDAERLQACRASSRPRDIPVARGGKRDGLWETDDQKRQKRRGHGVPSAGRARNYRPPSRCARASFAFLLRRRIISIRSSQQITFEPAHVFLHTKPPAVTCFARLRCCRLGPSSPRSA